MLEQGSPHHLEGGRGGGSEGGREGGRERGREGGREGGTRRGCMGIGPVTNPAAGVLTPLWLFTAVLNIKKR